ncbi:hypothetical protein GU926_08300 [Nibribacter ruber]|uniref:Uncharacterized protein n=1 Tax=Nibribacter ruber TaxID=2698458 RepID=A0A6P1NUM7_9BACT|nr:hypothetical protein [Nibribacter ruber]QHL87437.1 hypothetical protein GU926_08300 [Nibribacter ruber]
MNSNLEYKDNEQGGLNILRDGDKIGQISGGEIGVGHKKFWDIAHGVTEAPASEWSYWLKDCKADEYVNACALSSINQAKALAEHHFNK